MTQEEIITKLKTALQPFANAGERCVHYRSPRHSTKVVAYADEENCIYELHTIDQDLHGKPDELLSVQDLVDAHNILRQINEQS